MQRQYGARQTGIAQGSHKAGSVVAAAFDPAPNDHGSHHLGQSREYACKPDPARADFILHAGKNRR